jgi:hypothetical protein
MNHQGHGYGLLRMLIGCGLLLMEISVLSSIGVNWGVPFILLALIVCPLLMLLMSDAAIGRW